MTIATINASEDQSQYVGQVYQEQYARLRRYFLTQLGDGDEADKCVHETLRRLFFFMEDRDWEAEAEYVPVYLMRIAGFLCSRKLGEKRAQRAAGVAGGGESLFNKIRAEVFWVIRSVSSSGSLLSGRLSSRPDSPLRPDDLNSLSCGAR